MHRFQVAALFAITVLVACGGGRNSEPTEAAIGELRIVAGAGVSDTVQARPLQALVVEVREGGHPRPGLIVYFQTLPTADTTRRFESTILTSNIAANSFGTLTSDTTDASGRFHVEVDQTVRDLDGNIVATAIVEHVYTLRSGRVARFDIAPPQ